ncbi:MAG: recombination mediator RecR [Planctomycetota bacterium]
MGRAQSLDRLMQCLRRLPGIGPKSAERLAYHLLRVPDRDALALARAIEDAVRSTKTCSACFNLDEEDPCRVCRDPDRDQGTILVVEDPRDLGPLEGTGYRGLFHVLQGRLSSVEGIGPDDLTIGALERRLDGGTVREVCVATNPDLEGEATAKFVADRLRARVAVTRLARGLPAGSTLGQVSSSILTDAVEGRRPL